MDASLKQRLNDMKISAADGKDAIAIYSSLRAFESDFDKAQANLRTIASAWLLAAIGGLGLLFQTEFSDTNAIAPGLAGSLRQALILLSSMGLSSLWYLDQAVYQQLLHSVFALGCWLENKFSNLPPIRYYMFQQNRDITKRLSWFYLAPVLALGIAGVVNLAMMVWRFPHNSNKWCWSAVIAAIHLVFFCWIMMRRETWSKLQAELPPDLHRP